MKSGKNAALKKAGIIVIILAVLAGSYFVYRGFTRKDAKAASSFITYQVKSGSIQSSVSATGAIAASDSRDITVPSGSTIESVNCTEGQAVKAGDTLFTLSNDSSQLDLEKSKLNLTQLQSQLNSLNSQQGDLLISAPVSGIVKSVNFGVGDSVSPQGSQGGVVQIEDTSSMKFTVSSSSAGSNKPLLDSLLPGQEVMVAFSGVDGTKNAKVVSLSSSQQGNSITLQLLNTSGLSWDNYYNITFKMSGIDVTISGPVQVSGSTVNVNAKQSGTVTAVYVKPGDKVSSGSRLVSTKNDSIANQIQSAQVNIQSAQLDLNNKQSVINGLTVKAPIDGVVHNIQVKTGDVVGTAKTSSNAQASTQSGNVIASIENRSAMEVAVSVDELDIAKVQVGQDATITVDAFKDKTFTGKITSVASDGTASNGTSTFQVVVGIDNPEGLMVGMTANVSIVTASKDNALLLPVEAVQDRQGRKFVLVNENGTTTTKQVTLGIVNANFAEITSGLSEGDTVVVQFQNTTSNNSTNNSNQNAFRIPGMGGGQGYSGQGYNRGTNGTGGSSGANRTRNSGN